MINGTSTWKGPPPPMMLQSATEGSVSSLFNPQPALVTSSVTNVSSSTGAVGREPYGKRPVTHASNTTNLNFPALMQPQQTPSHPHFNEPVTKTTTSTAHVTNPEISSVHRSGPSGGTPRPSTPSRQNISQTNPATTALTTAPLPAASNYSD
ncbi:unnamed protein product, partial [Protopolystoma xenopodis]